jgi:hypothetical protein
MLVGITTKIFFKAKGILLACIVKAVTLVGFQSLFQQLFLTDLFVITVE